MVAYFQTLSYNGRLHVFMSIQAVDSGGGSLPQDLPLVHLAGNFKLRLKSLQNMNAINMNGTREVVFREVG